MCAHVRLCATVCVCVCLLRFSDAIKIVISNTNKIQAVWKFIALVTDIHSSEENFHKF